MPREKETYRLQLERLLERYKDKEILTYKEVSEYTGRSYRALKRQFKADERLGGIPLTTLAYRLS